MRKSLLRLGQALCAATACVLLLAGSVSAGGLYAPAPSAVAASWAGFYAGGEVGWGRADFDWRFTNPNYFNTLGAVIVGNDFDHKDSGAIGGLIAGYNYQSGPWLLGVELSVDATKLEQEKASPFFPAIDTFKSRLDWLATATVRLGYAWDRWLVFATGGYAGARLQLTLHDTPAAIHANDTLWANGWTLGGGVEYLLNDRVALGLSYTYVDLSLHGETITCPSCGTGVGFGTPVVNGDVAVQTVMARLTYLFRR